jgi:hypothetical protein
MAFLKSEEEAAKARADRESEVRQIAKEAGFLIRKNGCFYTLIEPEFYNLWDDKVIEVCKARIETRRAPQ